MDATETEAASGDNTGGYIALALFALPALICFIKAARSRTVSRRFAFLSAVCGLLLFVQVEFLYGIKPPSVGAILIGILRALISLAGVAYFVRALVLRVRDRGVGVFGPIVAFVFCALHGLIAFSLFQMPQAESAVTGQPWTYKSEEDGYEITLPSEYWVRARVQGAQTGFRCRTLPVQVGLQIEKESLSAFAKRATIFKANELPNLRAGVSESGKTPAGNDFFLAGGYEKQPTKEVLIHVAYVYRHASHQTFSFESEATLTTRSDENRAAQEAAIRDALRSMARSLR